MKLSVVIPTFNRKPALALTCQSLLNQSFRDFELIIANDGSSDDTESWVNDFAQSAWFPVHHCKQKNAGRSAARNMGVRMTQGDIVVFIDDHILLASDFLKEHADIHAHELNIKSKVVAVRGPVILIDTHTLPVDFPCFTPDPHRIQDPFYTFITHNISIRKTVLNEIGGFDEDFKNYGFQDSELGYRLKRKGYRFMWNCKAWGAIFPCGHTADQSWERARQVGLSAVLFGKKHPEARYKVGINILNHLFYILCSQQQEQMIVYWKKRADQHKQENRIKTFERFHFWIKHYYFCKGIFGDQ